MDHSTPCASPPSRASSNSCPLSRWYHQTNSSSVIPFSSFPESGSSPMSQLFTSGGGSIGASVSARSLEFLSFSISSSHKVPGGSLALGTNWTIWYLGFFCLNSGWFAWVSFSHSSSTSKAGTRANLLGWYGSLFWSWYPPGHPVLGT